MDQHDFSRIPKMDRLLALPAVAAAGEGLPRAVVRGAIQAALNDLRSELASGGEMPEPDALAARIAEAIRAARAWRLRPVINATGVVLHTNLGRAPLGDEIAAHVAEVAAGYSTLEYDIAAGGRGSRHDLVADRLCALTGAEAAMVVNNNAAAVFLMLNTLCAGGGAIVSRGELVEIGGAFRVPEIMRASGAALYEVGTTNKTRASDYEAALAEENIRAILKVHTSNFKIMGFTESVEIEALSRIAHTRGAYLLYDLGAGFLVRPESLGLREGAYVPDAVKHADVCCFSGDKLFGAGQAGILLGKRELIDRMKRNQLARMLRVDKLTLASLEAALRLYADADAARAGIPVLKMLSMTEAELTDRANRIAVLLSEKRRDYTFTVVPCEDEPGGGSLPTVVLRGCAVAVTKDGESADRIEARFRARGVIGRILRDRFILSMRTITDEDALTAAVGEI